jgi:hypothetical protein
MAYELGCCKIMYCEIVVPLSPDKISFRYIFLKYKAWTFLLYNAVKRANDILYSPGSMVNAFLHGPGSVV